MAELADAPDLGSGVYDVQVQVLLSAFNQISESLENTVAQGFLLFILREMGHKRGKLKSVLHSGSDQSSAAASPNLNPDKTGSSVRSLHRSRDFSGTRCS